MMIEILNFPVDFLLPLDINPMMNETTDLKLSDDKIPPKEMISMSYISQNIYTNRRILRHCRKIGMLKGRVALRLIMLNRMFIKL